MVGIFLRLLEYHQGVLFLTTNRIKCIDEAFNSRISVALNYEDLTLDARIQVWKNFIELAAGTDSKIDPLKFKHYDLNGRQIRSSVRLAQTLANSESIPMNEQHIHTTVAIAINFREQFKSIKSDRKQRKTLRSSGLRFSLSSPSNNPSSANDPAFL